MNQVRGNSCTVMVVSSVVRNVGGVESPTPNPWARVLEI